MSAHTPGRWAIDPDRPDYHGRKLGFYVHAPGGGGGRIGQVFENCLVTSVHEARANAAVFAAAPDMLKALEFAAQALAGADASRQPAYRAVAAAIAMATDERALLTSCDDRR